MISRYWHTIRYLQPIQIYGRLWFKFYRPRPDSRPAPARQPLLGEWAAPIERPAMMTGRCRFRFLNVEREVKHAEDWDDSSVEALWRYHLHYFDDLNAEAALDRADWHLEALRRWLTENSPGEGIGWDPYPTSLRIVNWIKWLQRPDIAGRDGIKAADRALYSDVVTSLAVQARWLRKRLEHHLLGNHLLANAKALVFAGCFFEGLEANRWRQRGERLLRRELEEQILPDGGHFERSPMYHAIVLEDLLDVANLARAYPGVIDKALVEAIKAKLPAMLSFLAGVSHPDGEIAFFNDAAMGMSPTPKKILDYAQRLGIEWFESRDAIQHWPETGIVRLDAGDAVVLMDVGPVGPDYQPGHAHADTLSFELSVFGQRVLVNGGTSGYGKGLQRHAERSTAAHNTVEIDGENSSEVWGGFRVARRARVHDVEVGKTPDGKLFVEAWHDGYARLKGRPIHRRRLELRSDRLTCIDIIDGGCEDAVAYFHCHPSVRVGGDTDQTGVLLGESSKQITWAIDGGNAAVLKDQWHPEFGRSEPSETLKVRLAESKQSKVTLAWKRA